MIKDNLNLKEAREINCFNKGSDAFIKCLVKAVESRKIYGVGIIKFYNNWADKKRINYLERRWIRIEVRKLLLRRRKKIYKIYAEALKLRPTRFDNAR